MAQIINFNPKIEISFWQRLSAKKIEEYKLDCSPKDIFGSYRINNFNDKYSFLSLSGYSFDLSNIVEQNFSGPVEVKLKGHLINLNKIEDFNSFNYQKLLESFYENIDSKIQRIINSLHANQSDYELGDLFEFSLITFADLKKYIFNFQFMFPLFEHSSIDEQKILGTVCDLYKDMQLKILNNLISEFCFNNASITSPFIFLSLDENKPELLSFQEYIQSIKADHNEHLLIVYIDAFNQSTKFNSMMNILLYAIHKIFELLKIEGPQKECLKYIKVLKLNDTLIYKKNQCVKFKNSTIHNFNIFQLSFNKIFKQINESRQIDLKALMDEQQLAANAVDLNVKLMKWRQLPELNIEKVQQTKCLLIGAGTLGCQLSRNLIGWGVRNITFIDYGKVSYSNPVRQSLFTFEDSIKGGQPKAACAADSLKKIFPDINAVGVDLEIPMPGHFLTSAEQEKNVVQSALRLQELIVAHDAVFLLTDSREARWLPTVLAALHNKICITVALGFETYIVIRHGASPWAYKSELAKESRLPCYFCSDYISPGNTMRDRTLDQQCTVTRPGGSFISSAIASELLVSLLHHPLENCAPDCNDEYQQNSQNEQLKDDPSETPLGILPQMIRGQLSDFSMKTFHGKAFTQCVACSEYVLDAIKQDYIAFVLKAINDSQYLQKVTKIDETLKEGNDDDIFDFDMACQQEGDVQKDDHDQITELSD